jgi:hypothetical protein
MPITHILMIVDDAEGVQDIIDNVGSIQGFEGSALLITDTVQGAINLLADGDCIQLGRQLNG